MKALIIGATGATGKDLVQVLLQDSAYTQILIFVRRATGINHPKLVEIFTDFDDVEAVSTQIIGDVLFSCLGTTLKAAGSKEKQWHVDLEIPMKFAELARKNDVSGIVLLSAYGASTTSSVFYSRMKGKLEEATTVLAFNRCIIFRPGLLLRKQTDRSGERVMAGVLKFINMLGIVRKFRPMPTQTLAEKMARSARILPAGKHVIELDKIFSF